MSVFWNVWIIGLTVICVALVMWILLANRKVAIRDDEDPENRTTGHVYDGIEEYDNPLPLWWFRMFVATFVFLVGYLIVYPGLGSFPGVIGWTSAKALAKNQEAGREQYAESYERFNNMSIEELVHDNSARKMGVRLFANNCAVCHGADGGGNFGIPNLTDSDWLYGGSPESIQASITHGRAGNMPAWGSILGEEKVQQTTAFVRKISGQDHDAGLASAGQQVFAQNCAACHGQNAKGMQALGAPNLTDDVWLYSGSEEGIAHSIRSGLSNNMPAQQDLLREEKIHVLAAYVYSLSFDYGE